jgi:hypothetical protein
MLLDIEVTLDASLDLNAAVAVFCQAFREVARQQLETMLQSRIEECEAAWRGARQIRTKCFATPVGEIQLKRRAYLTEEHFICCVDETLGLPDNGWFPCFEEIAAALGVSSEFPHACHVLAQWTGLELSDHGLANRVEALGADLEAQELTADLPEVYPLDSALHRAVCRVQMPRSVVYIQADGIHVPMNQGQGTKEARVGVVFWEAHHLTLCPTRNEIRQREYVATLSGLAPFKNQLFKAFARVVNQTPCQPVVMGDGASWIWRMADEEYPNAIEILDFFHVAEYVWDVARAQHPEQQEKQKAWVDVQLKLLKESKWQDVVAGLDALKARPPTQEAAQSLETYLQNNSTRIDYKRYLELGLMIGSGVVESSNRRIVTQRLKQSGMHWSDKGANGVMALRACYLSSSDRWRQIWKQRAT